jgi:hypothetical protein
VQAQQDRINGLMSGDGQTPTQTVGGLLNGQALLLVRPAYPLGAAGASGIVRVRILIDECGTVKEAKAESGPIPLRRPSEDAALLAKFSPTLKSNTPVKVTGVIEYNFFRK